MHSHSLDKWTHEHVFLGADHARNERRTWLVVGLTAAMMVAEIVGGILFGSMALLADGWHMSTHAGALAIAALAYLYARRHARDTRFAFGTGKLGELAGFSSALVLAMIAVLIAYESAVRLARPVPIAYAEAIAIAAVGLAVNLVCAWLLRDDHNHHHRAHAHAHDHAHDHHHHRDHNLRAAYLHVLADAATSVLAIGGLVLARAFDWPWIDAVVGLIGACLIASWAYGLMRDSGQVLLDVVPDRDIESDIRTRLETGGDRICDLHLWQVGPGHRAAVISIVTERPQAPSTYKDRLAGLHGLSHVTVEVQPCPHEEPHRAA
jgi:cation diffusion facilitator family transporter